MCVLGCECVRERACKRHRTVHLSQSPSERQKSQKLFQEMFTQPPTSPSRLILPPACCAANIHHHPSNDPTSPLSYYLLPDPTGGTDPIIHSLLLLLLHLGRPSTSTRSPVKLYYYLPLPVCTHRQPPAGKDCPRYFPVRLVRLPFPPVKLWSGQFYPGSSKSAFV